MKSSSWKQFNCCWNSAVFTSCSATVTSKLCWGHQKHQSQPCSKNISHEGKQVQMEWKAEHQQIAAKHEICLCFPNNECIDFISCVYLCSSQPFSILLMHTAILCLQHQTNAVITALNPSSFLIKEIPLCTVLRELLFILFFFSAQVNSPTSTWILTWPLTAMLSFLCPVWTARDKDLSIFLLLQT